MKCSLFLALVFSASLLAADNPFLGRWAVTTPEGKAAWISIEETGSKLSTSILWGGGSVLPAAESAVRDGVLTVKQTVPGKNPTTLQTITATCTGDALAIVSTTRKEDGTEITKGSCTAKRLPPLPPRPDLGKVVFGEPIALITGHDLNGWQRVEQDRPNGWSVSDGVLSNRVPEKPVKGKRNANLRTDAEFADFRLTTEVRTLEGSNSGIYLRGVYEIQIAESFGKPLDSHNMGALYSRITPMVAAEKPVGEWQALDITLVDQHVTVILNGKTLIDNQPAMGCTGGALTSEDSLHGPIMLQGDHTSIDYRNMVVRPVRK